MGLTLEWRTVLPKKGSWQPYSNINISTTLSSFFSFNCSPEKTSHQTGFGLWLTVWKSLKWCGLCCEEGYCSLGRSLPFCIRSLFPLNKPSPKRSGFKHHWLVLRRLWVSWVALLGGAGSPGTGLTCTSGPAGLAAVAGAFLHEALILMKASWACSHGSEGRAPSSRQWRTSPFQVSAAFLPRSHWPRQVAWPGPGSQGGEIDCTSWWDLGAITPAKSFAEGWVDRYGIKICDHFGKRSHLSASWDHSRDRMQVMDVKVLCNWEVTFS